MERRSPGFIGSLPAGWQWIQFLPLVVFQAVAITVMCRLTRDQLRTIGEGMIVDRIVRHPHRGWGLAALAVLAFALAAVTFFRWQRTVAPVRLTRLLRHQ